VSTFFFLIITPPPRSTLFPYTTLFRSELSVERRRVLQEASRVLEIAGDWARGRRATRRVRVGDLLKDLQRDGADQGGINDVGCRSEEHTSELQSRGHLVCRLLLEKKNK